MFDKCSRCLAGKIKTLDKKYKYNRIYKEKIVGISMEKRGQVTIFILIALVLVSVILIFFLWVRPTYFLEESGGLKFEGCVRDALEETIDDLSVNAGFVNPTFTYPYEGEDFTYLCYTEEYYETCVVQVPFLKNTFEEQAERALREDVEACYSGSISDLKVQGFDVTSGSVDYEVLLEPGVAKIQIEAPTTVGSQKFTRFNVKLNSHIYDMLMIATSILQYEAQLGDSDVTVMMGLYPDYIIDKIKRGDGTTIYILEDKVFGTKYQFASKSLVWPAGYIF